MSNEYKYNLGERIKQRRKELGLTQTELAKKLGLSSKTTISKVELGDDNLTTASIQRYADALETTPTSLLGLAPFDSSELNPDHVIKRAKEDASLIEKYRNLDDNSQRIIMNTIDALLNTKKV